MPEEQIGEVFETLFEAVRNKGGNANDGVPAHARPAAAAEAPKKLSQEELKKKFDPNDEAFDPRGAMLQIVNENYGGLIGDINRNAAVGVLNDLRTRIPGFKDYEQDVLTVISKDPSRGGSQENILRTFYEIKGFRETEKAITEALKPPTTRQPAPAREETNNAVPKLDAEEMAVARVMFPGVSDADLPKEMAKATAQMEKGTIRVPGDKKPAPKGGTK